MNYLMTFLLFSPDKVFHTRAAECENTLPHKIENCGFLSDLIKTEKPELEQIQPPCSTKKAA